jgi:hypothetical protein
MRQIRQAVTEHVKIDLVLPEEVAGLIRDFVENGNYWLRFQRLYMSLNDLIEPDFFNAYVKTSKHLKLYQLEWI